jgi:hypothetical protein
MKMHLILKASNPGMGKKMFYKKLRENGESKWAEAGGAGCRRPLLTRPTDSACGTLEDAFTCIAATIEESLLENDALPGIDYNRLDLFKLAQPFVLQMFKDKKVDFVIKWPKPDSE